MFCPLYNLHHVLFAEVMNCFLDGIIREVTDFKIEHAPGNTHFEETAKEYTDMLVRKDSFVAKQYEEYTAVVDDVVRHSSLPESEKLLFQDWLTYLKIATKFLRKNGGNHNKPLAYADGFLFSYNLQPIPYRLDGFLPISLPLHFPTRCSLGLESWV